MCKTLMVCSNLRRHCFILKENTIWRADASPNFIIKILEIGRWVCYKRITADGQEIGKDNLYSQPINFVNNYHQSPA